MIETLALIAIAAVTIHLIARHRMREPWPVLDQWEADTEASIVEALALVEETPIYDQLAERRDSFDRTAAQIRALPTWEGRQP